MSMANETLHIDKENDNTNFFVRFFKYFIPWKGDHAAEVVRKVIFIGSIALFCSSVNQLTDFLETDKDTLEYTAQIQSLEPDFTDDINFDQVKADDGENSSPEAKQRKVQAWAKKAAETQQGGSRLDKDTRLY